MFSDKKDKKERKGVQTTARNLIAESTLFKGDIVSQGDFRIDGTVEGSIKTEGRVIIGKKGVVKGDVSCGNADFEGVFLGELEVQTLLTLKSTANISGTVCIGKLMVEPGAEFNASCTMKGAIKELKNNDSQKNKQKKIAAS